MNKLPWLDELRHELARHKLPPLYVERLVLELSDHFTDCMEDSMSTDAKNLQSVVHRLGQPSQIAGTAAAQYRRQRFSGRHPVITFAALPILTLPLLWAVSIAGVIGIANLFGLGKETAGDGLSQLTIAYLPYVIFGVVLLPAIVSAAFFSRVARISAVDWKWPLLACGLVALFASLAQSRIVTPAGSSHGSISFGLGIGAQPTMYQVIQFAVPLAIGIWAAWRQVKQHRYTLAS